MNERIREFRVQACTWAIENVPMHEYENASDEKFAQLIIADAINTVERRFMGDLNREDMEVRRCVEALKNHFGVYDEQR
jgi:hypothetical protein